MSHGIIPDVAVIQEMSVMLGHIRSKWSELAGMLFPKIRDGGLDL